MCVVTPGSNCAKLETAKCEPRGLAVSPHVQAWKFERLPVAAGRSLWAGFCAIGMHAFNLCSALM